jgi:hypothetical protein
MRVDTVQTLMGDVVRLAQRVDQGDNFRFVSAGLNKMQQHTAAFLLNYNDMALGWKAAAMFARAHAQLPVYLTADDQWIWRAYLTQCNPDLYFDKHVAEAEALMDISMQHQRHTIQALLLSDDADFTDIAKITGLSVDTLVAYEKLFFNVKDRREDAMFLAKHVYPHGRLEELYDNYLRNTTFGDLLRRTGYNCGKDYVVYMSGLRSKLIKDMSVGDMASQLERVVMANGFFLASSGLINQRSDAQGLRTAQSMITAAKAGGMENPEQSGFDDITVSIALRGELAHAGRVKLESNQRSLKRLDANTFDAEVATVNN